MAKTLTDAFVKAIRTPSKARVEYADLRCVGLAFRVTASGVRSWCFRFRDPRSGRSSRIGDRPLPCRVPIRRPVNWRRPSGGWWPKGKIRLRSGARSAVEAPQKTFEALAARYMAEHADRHKRPRSAAEDRRNLDLHILPRWRNRRYEDLRRADLIELVEGLVKDGKPTLANRVHALLSKIGAFSVDADLLVGNPFAGIKKRGQENIGRRILLRRRDSAFLAQHSPSPSFTPGRPGARTRPTNGDPLWRGRWDDPRRNRAVPIPAERAAWTIRPTGPRTGERTTFLYLTPREKQSEAPWN